MTVLELDKSPRVTKVLDVVRHFTVDERIVLAKLLLDTVVEQHTIVADDQMGLAEAANLLLADYEEDEELTSFTVLDGEPFDA